MNNQDDNGKTTDVPVNSEVETSDLDNEVNDTTSIIEAEEFSGETQGE